MPDGGIPLHTRQWTGRTTRGLQIEEINRTITDFRQRQEVLRDSTANSERTMNQLLELQRLTLQKGMVSSAEEQQALAESQKLFLANQTRYQQINEQIATLSEQLRDLERRQRDAQRVVDTQREPVQREYQARYSRHQWKLAALKLAVLVPLLAAAGWLFLKRRGGLYSPLIHGFGLAVLIKVGMVMQEHFPRRYFKYVLIGVAILVVARVLVYLLRLRAYPKPDWLLKQYREAYEHFLCPACGYPIRRGPLRYLFWTRRSLRRLRIPIASEPRVDEPYTCPACGTVLFEECSSCHAVRHAHAAVLHQVRCDPRARNRRPPTRGTSVRKRFKRLVMVGGFILYSVGLDGMDDGGARGRHRGGHARKS